MKRIAALVLALSSTSLMAGEANMFHCKGENLELQASTSSLTGRPSVVRITPSVGANPWALKNVEIVKNNMGLQISAETGLIADGIETYNLIVPAVEMASESEVAVDGVVIHTLEGVNFVVGMPVLAGPRQMNTVIPVQCTASKMTF